MSEPIAPETLKSALKAFRKRLKVTRLDEESRLGRSPLPGGAKAGVMATQPPSQFPAEVWEELAKQGKLKPAGKAYKKLVKRST